MEKLDQAEDNASSLCRYIYRMVRDETTIYEPPFNTLDRDEWKMLVEATIFSGFDFNELEGVGTDRYLLYVAIDQYLGRKSFDEEEKELRQKAEAVKSKLDELGLVNAGSYDEVFFDVPMYRKHANLDQEPSHPL